MSKTKWQTTEKTYFVAYAQDGSDEETAKQVSNIREAHKLCLSARELGIKASILVSQRISPVGDEGESVERGV